jgi:hypothetical protein
MGDDNDAFTIHAIRKGNSLEDLKYGREKHLDFLSEEQTCRFARQYRNCALLPHGSTASPILFGRFGTLENYGCS